MSVIAGVASLFAGIILLPFILGAVGAERYGVWLVLSSVASYLYFADIGVGAAITHYGSRSRGGENGPSLKKLLFSGLVFSTGACLAIAPMYYFFTSWYVGTWGTSMGEQEKAPIIWLSLGLMVPLLLRPFGSALVGAGFLTIDRRNQVVGVAVRVVGTLIACAYGFGIVGIAIAELMALVVPSVLSILSLYARRLLSFERGDISRDTLRLMLRFSYRSFSVSLVGALTVQSGVIMIGLVGSPAEATYYNAAFRIYGSVRQLLAWTVDPFKPALSRLYASNRAEASSVLKSVLLVSLGAGAAASCALIIAVPDLVTIWLGGAVPAESVSLTAQILLAGLLLNMVHIPLAPATDAVGKPGTLFWGQILWLCLCLGLGYPLATEFGIIGIALALSAPLILVEPFMLKLALPPIGLSLTEWYFAVAKPIVVLISVSLGGSALIVSVIWFINLDYLWLWFAFAFCVCVLVTVFVLNRTFRLQESIAVLNVEL
nr:oligosaccharide flippase family protein [Arthrobacter jiangjiafuii]